MKIWLKNNYKHILALGIAAGFLFITEWKMGFFFQTNDDRYMAELLAGVATGKNETYLIYINYLLALPLALLYKFFSTVPWYGGCLLLFMGVAIYVLVDSALSRTKKWAEIAAVVVSAGMMYLLQMYLFAQIQYTSVAVFLTLAGFAGLFLYTEERTGRVSFGVLLLLGYLLRSQAMLMIVPLGMVIWGCVILLYEGLSLKEKIQKILLPAAIVAAVLGIGLIGNLIGKLGEDWSTFEEFNGARTTIFDYYEMPEYEEVEHILLEYDVDRTEYEALSEYVILRWDVSPKCMTQLAEYVEENAEKTEVWAVTGEIRKLLFEEEYWNVGDVLILLCAGVFVWALLPGNRRMLLPLAGLCGTAYAELFYLVWKGRYPLHVILPFLIGVIYVLLILVWRFFTGQKEKKVWYQAFLVALGLLCLYKTYFIGQEQYRDIKDLHRNEEIYIQGLRDIEEYCAEREEQKFLIDIFAMMYYNGEVLEVNAHKSVNYRLTGSWFANTPFYSESLREYLEGADGIYLIVNSDENVMERAVVAYLAEKMGCEPEAVDSFTASHGGSYEVIYFAGTYTVQSLGVQ